MFAYTYAVTGVRRAREGNIGPALIDIGASKSQANYLGIDLSTDKDWVYHSPMSWRPDGKKAMWMEKSEERRGGQECVSRCRYRWSEDNKKKKKRKIQEG